MRNFSNRCRWYLLGYWQKRYTRIGNSMGTALRLKNYTIELELQTTHFADVKRNKMTSIEIEKKC